MARGGFGLGETGDEILRFVIDGGGDGVEAVVDLHFVPEPHGVLLLTAGGAGTESAAVARPAISSRLAAQPTLALALAIRLVQKIRFTAPSLALPNPAPYHRVPSG